MRVVIDLIEDIRESIANAESYQLMVALLKAEGPESNRMHYVGEAPIGSFEIDNEARRVYFQVVPEGCLRVGDLIPKLLILDMDAMMYRLSINVNEQYKQMEVVGFGKNDEEERYILFIQV